MSSSLTEDLELDVRIVERRLAKGLMARAEADALTKDLPDLSDKAEWVDVESLDDDEDSDLDDED